MIAWFIKILLQFGAWEKPTSHGVMLRLTIVVFLLALYLFLFVLVLIMQKRKRIRKITALILLAILVIETAQLIPCLQGEKHVPLEYVCTLETTDNDHHDAESPTWYTDCTWLSERASKKEMEQILHCSLADVDFEEEFTYLFVYSFKEVDLAYSYWSKCSSSLGDIVYWLGDLTVRGEDTDNTIYVFRFPRQTIINDDKQWDY